MTVRRAAGAPACLATALLVCLALGGCGEQRARPQADTALRALEREARPVGAAPRFHPPAPRRVRGACRPALGARYPVHLEVFAADRVVLVPAGIGVAPPRRTLTGRIVAGRCFGALVTLDPTGVVLVRRSDHPTLGSLFAAWRQPLSARALTGFTAPRGETVRVYVDGRRRRGEVSATRLTPDAEIVLEVGPFVPPHTRYAFPPVPALPGGGGKSRRRTTIAPDTRTAARMSTSSSTVRP